MESLGKSSPLGATVCDGGVNFSLFSRSAAAVELLFFDHEDHSKPSRVVKINPVTNRTYHYWHVFVPGVRPGQLYAYRVQGPTDPAKGLRFDPAKALLDPYGKGVVVPRNYSRTAASQPAPCTLIYEMHVRGFTRHPSSGVAEWTSGTYAGLVEKIPYLHSAQLTTSFRVR